jgi:hypothetical protein
MEKVQINRVEVYRQNWARLKGALKIQTNLVNKLFDEEVFWHEDIENIYMEPTEEEAREAVKEAEGERFEELSEEEVGDMISTYVEDKKEPCEVYAWYYCLDDYIVDKCKETGIPVLENEYGAWIGRTDWGSSWDLYFLPALYIAVWGEEEQV